MPTAIELLPIPRLKPAERNARLHSKKQVRQLADNIERFGFTNPVLIDEDGCILAGHGRLARRRNWGWRPSPACASIT